MGLSAVHGIVGSYGGTVTVQSKPRQGSSFIIYLPVVNALNETEIPEGMIIPTGKERILFIDDEVVLAEAGKKTLPENFPREVHREGTKVTQYNSYFAWFCCLYMKDVYTLLLILT